MKALFAAAFLLAAAPAAAQVIQSASGDWSDIPMMHPQPGAAVEPGYISAMSDLVVRGRCTFPGQDRGNVDLNVPFLVNFRDDGSVEEVVVHPVGCPNADRVVAGAVLRMIERGGYTPPGQRRQGWFRGEIGFAFSNG